jgi:CRISPR-associated protein Csx10
MSEGNSAMLLDKSFTLRLTMLSDWHIGRGAGIPGSIDALLSKDSEGFPCVPAKTIVGIWRDAMERLAYGLDNANDKGSWSKWVEVIFGIQPNQIDKDELTDRLSKNEKTYSHSILSLQPARLSEGLRETIISKDDIRLQQALTFIKPEIRIDEKSGTAADEALRFVEMGRIGTILEAECTLDLNTFSDSEKKTISALLIASAKLVERIGGKRRRGAGKCNFEIAGKDGKKVLEEAVNYLKQLNNPSRSTIGEASEATIAFSSPEADNTWHKMDYTLQLQTPVAIVTATLGNVSETLDFIPGTYLLPHLTKGKSLFKHVANGDIQVSPATIEVDGARGLPVPKVISAYKVRGGFHIQGTVFNKFKDKTNGTPQLKPYRDGYVSTVDVEKQLPVYAKTNITLQMHNTVQDDVQRPTSEIVGVYSRQAIAAGTTLRGEIRFKTELLKVMESLQNTTAHIRLGTSKKDDYGLATLSIGAAQVVPSAATAKEELIVYLESDILLRNANLRQTNLAEDLKRELEIALGEGTLNIPNSNEVQDAPIIHTRRIESWHEGWGFPRPTLIAMRAGSCVKFEVTSKIDSSKLQALEKAGIGERRGEGYGRIRFNPKMLTEPINTWDAAKNKTHGGNSNDGASPKGIEPEMHKFAKQLELTTWREELQRAVLLIADDKEKRREIFGFEYHKGESVPPHSQIGGLRSAIMRMKDNSNNSKNLVINWLKHLEDTPNRIKKWDRNSNTDEAKKKTAEIKKLINDESKIWLVLCDAKINGNNVWQSPPTLLRKEKELQTELWAEAVRSLFDACMRAHKREGGGN